MKYKRNNNNIYCSYSTYLYRQIYTSVDPDQMSKNETSDQGLHCLPHIQQQYSHTMRRLIRVYSETCVRKPPLRVTSVVDMERWLSYKGTCHVILLATCTFIRQTPFPQQPLFKVSLKGGSLTQVSLYTVCHSFNSI